ncbi:hypothetical protein Bbelb_122880 [Branchiostoma belcheri]|nr:hypothetical protein Bbelb_122880 [Branchiostoma belcheri]
MPTLVLVEAGRHHVRILQGERLVVCRLPWPDLAQRYPDLPAGLPPLSRDRVSLEVDTARENTIMPKQMFRGKIVTFFAASGAWVEAIEELAKEASLESATSHGCSAGRAADSLQSCCDGVLRKGRNVGRNRSSGNCRGGAAPLLGTGFHLVEVAELTSP